MSEPGDISPPGFILYSRGLPGGFILFGLAGFG